MRWLLPLAAISLFAADYPKTRTDNVTETLHGKTITDPYRWLEDQKSPETRAWLDAQMKYTEAYLAKVPGRDKIAKRLSELMRVDTMSSPEVVANRYFFTRRRSDQNQPVYFVRYGLNGREQVLLDGNTLSPDQTSSGSLMHVSKDGRLAAWGLRVGGEDELAVSFRDVDTKQDLADKLPRGRYSVAITPDRKGAYYSRFTPQGPRLYYHAFGTDVSKDALIFGEKYDPVSNIGVGVSEDGRWLRIGVSYGAGGNKNEIYLKDLSQPNSPIKPFVEGIEARFSLQFAGEYGIISTNWKAPKGRVMRVDWKNPGMDNWKEIIPEGKNVIQGVQAAAGRIFVNRLVEVKNEIQIYDVNGKTIGAVKLPAIGSASTPDGPWDGNEVFYSFTSFGRPLTSYRMNVSDNKTEIWSKNGAPVDPEQFEVKQLWFTSKDKTRVPMFVAHKKGLKLDGSNPALLTGYGGFNLAQLPGFSAMGTVFMEMGGVFAMANMRGGSEFGEAWHRAGMLENKQNVFDDFIGAAENLIERGYTSKSKLAINGGSNGGLLVGAALTQRPDLFKAVICGAPLLDMIRYHKFLVARFWVPEYGSSEDPKQFDYILKYSPYQNVKKGEKYPAVMFVTGDADTRVDPLHARKMAALMQASTGSDNPILLHYDTKAGHSQGLPVGKQIENSTDSLAFLMSQLGMK
jgi:prolyl oligopeptidase